MKILVAEDDSLSRRLLARTLENWGHEAIAASDGREAWERFQAGDISFIVTDWVMPRMDGIELSRRIRASQSRLGGAYIVLLTARDSLVDLAGGFDAGADDFIAKPFNQVELRARIQAGERMLDLQRQLVNARQEMELLALTDALTGLPNRRALMNHVATDEQRMHRESKPLGVVLLDVDNFKQVNDSLGHAAGDTVLRAVADCLQETVRGADHVGRWGGDEFLLLLPGASASEAAEIAERCREKIAGRKIVATDGDAIRVTVSLGAAAGPIDAWRSAADLLQLADQALYQAKDAGRNRLQIALDGPERIGGAA